VGRGLDVIWGEEEEEGEGGKKGRWVGGSGVALL